MRKFEEWYNTLNNCYTTETEKRMQHTAWKAALEWVMAQTIWYTNDIGLTDFGIIEGVNFIKEELSDK